MTKRVKIHRTRKEFVAALRGARDGTLALWWIVYHKGHRARIRRFSSGFQPTPWRCLKCKKAVEDPDDLRYNLASTPCV